MIDRLVYGLIYSRIKMLVSRKSFSDDNQAFEYFLNMFPRNTDTPDYEVIGGSLLFIKDYLMCLKTICKKSNNTVTIVVNNADSVVFTTSDGTTISCVHYSSQFPNIFISYTDTSRDIKSISSEERIRILNLLVECIASALSDIYLSILLHGAKPIDKQGG